MDKVIILSNDQQFRRYLKLKGQEGGTWRLFCDSPAFSEALNERQVPHTLLDEFLIRKDWSKINSWGCGTAASFAGMCAQNNLFREVNWAAVFHLFFSLHFVGMLKCFHYAQIITATCRQGDELWLFSGLKPRKYPDYSGNLWLHVMLAEAAAQKGIPVRIEAVIDHGIAISEFPQTQNAIKGFVKTLVKKLTASVLTQQPPSGRTRLILLHGALKHLGGVGRELVHRGIPVVLYDSAFHRDQWEFAKTNKIPYLLPDAFGKIGNDQQHAFCQNNLTEIRNILKHSQFENFFVFNGFNFRPFILEHITGQIDAYVTELANADHAYRGMLKSQNIAGVLTDEDYALRGGYFAALMNHFNIPVFCISHANPSAGFSTPEDARQFGQSTTFVQSRHERDAYASRGWNPSHIEVSGIPRYDRFSVVPQRKKILKEFTLRTPFRLLYCANTNIKRQTAESYGYLGHHLGSYASVSVPAFDAVMAAVRNLPIHVTIKPHNYEGVREWQSFLDKSQTDARQVSVFKKSISIDQLFNESDAMVLSYWSTSIIEAALSGLPVVIADLHDILGATLKPFEQTGLCMRATDREGLKSIFQRLIKSPPFVRESTARDNDEARDYLLGKSDGLSASRISDFIMAKTSIKARLKNKGEEVYV